MPNDEVCPLGYNAAMADSDKQNAVIIDAQLLTYQKAAASAVRPLFGYVL